MAKQETLFTLPIGEKGRVVCLKPRERVYVLEFASPPDNRLDTVGNPVHIIIISVLVMYS